MNTKVFSRPDSGNQFLVGVWQDRIVILQAVPRVLTVDQALNLAGWLAVLADPAGERFAGILKEIQNT